MEPFSENAKWIWHPRLKGGELDPRVCFRNSFTAPTSFQTGQTAAELLITADSRYVVWIDGCHLGEGPPRYWPWRRHVDSYDISGLLRGGALHTVAVMVHSIGVATSSYIPGRGGLLAELLVDGQSAFGTDGAWESFVHPAFAQGPPRINVSQPFVERFDAREDPGDWQRGESVSEAVGAAVIGPAEPEIVTGPMGAPSRAPWPNEQTPQAVFATNEVSPLAEESQSFNIIRYVRRITSEPVALSVDFKRAFFPGDLSTEDKLQVGAIAVAVNAPTRHVARITRKNRRWPYETELLWVNGKEHQLPPHTWAAEVTLEEGRNLVLLDVSGAYQRFWIDIVLESNYGANFVALSPLSELQAAAFGPYDHADIGNIVCADGFEVDVKNTEYQALQGSQSVEDLVKHTAHLKTINEQELCPQNPKLVMEFRKLGGEKRIVSDHAPLRLDLNDGPIETHLDFGDEVSGFLELEIEGPVGTIVDGVMCEYHDGHTPELPDDLNNWFRYTCAAGRRTFRSALRRGFRHLLLSIYPSDGHTSLGEDQIELTLHRIVCQERLYPTPVQGEFSCSDRELTEIYQMSKRTVALCMEDTFVDCPGFEQALWVGDTRNTALLAYVLFGSYGLGRNSLMTAAQSLLRSPLPESHVPSGVPLVLTAWALLWMIACEEYTIHSGDTEFAAEVAPWVRAASESLHSYINDRGLLEISAWNMLDWAPMDTPYHGIVTHQNMLAVWALRSAGRLLGGCSNVEEDVVRFIESDADRLATAINTHLWSLDKGAFVDCIRGDGSVSDVISVQTQLIALLSGTVPNDRLSEVETLVESPTETMVKIGSPFMSFFLFRYMSDHGQFDELLTTVHEGWGSMIEEGSTTCWETFRGFYTDRLTRSYCHAWSAAPAWYLPEVVLGIRRTSPGWKEVEVSPFTANLTWAKGSVVTPYGPIVVRWEKDQNDKLDLEVKAPEAVTVRKC